MPPSVSSPSFRLIPLLAMATALAGCGIAPAGATPVPAPKRTAIEKAPHATAVLAGGCFWGMELVFSHLRGVTSVVSGFEGGSASTATYERVSDGDTGHAESVRITYDPRVIRYDQLLRVYFTVATDPTQLNRQTPDVGTQYRGAIVPMGPEQDAVARAYLAQLRAADPWHRPIATAIEPWRGFTPAETYHQDFALKNPGHPYLRAWDYAKLDALKATFPQWYKADFTPG